MGTRNAETNQGDSCPLPRDGGCSSAPPIDQIRSRAGNTVFKSGPLFISSKGIGWTSWKKRWFILTRTSLVFFRSDPSVIPQKGSDVNLTLGGIDLNNSGSVVVKEDKKLLTVLFPDGRDGRAFTLKAETSEDLHDWKTALENALGQAPSAALVMGQNGIFRNEPTEPTETVDGGFEKWTDKQPAKSMVIGRPILLALEDIDGAPSFLEKALTFIEEHGVKTEGILRQAADVDDVNRRVREYEEGKDEFSSEEDAHVIADCVKHVLRALPSSPVPASCCKALLEACRAERGNRINAMRSAIAETFPEPNRRLLQRILQMMQIVASHKAENRMSSSAVSACMAPLLLRPLLAGDCELENDFNMGGDGSVQLLQAAAAANHAQAIVITLLEEYDYIFGDYTLQEGSVSPELYSDSEESGSEDDELTDDDEIVEDDEILQDDEDICNQHNPDGETDDEGPYSGTITESYCTSDDEYDNKVPEESGSEFDSTEGGKCGTKQMTSGGTQTSCSQKDNVQSNINMQSRCYTSSEVQTAEFRESIDVPSSTIQPHEETDQSLSSPDTKSTCDSNENFPTGKRRNFLGRTSARKNLSMGSAKRGNEDMVEIQKLELTKNDLQSKISREAKKNAVLRACLEDRKNELHARRVALEQDVEGLQAQLQKERDLRLTMEARLNHPTTLSTISPAIDDKTKADLEEMSQAEEDVVNLKKKVADLHMQLNQQSKNIYGSVCGSCGQPQRANHLEQQNDREEDIDTAIAGLPLDKSRKSEDGLSRADSGNTREETQSSSNKQREKQQIDTTDTKHKMASSGSSNSRKSCTKAEGSVATSSALSKLTTRLHFLKERRTQIVNELQNIENSRGGGDTQMLATPSRMNSR